MKSTAILFLSITLCVVTLAHRFSAVSAPLQARVETLPPDAQNTAPCPDALVMSDLYLTVSGTVVKVVDGETVTLSENNRRWLIHLVGIDASPISDPLGEEARKHLESIVKGKVVEIWYKGYRPAKGKEITGIVKLLDAERSDMNLKQISAGMAKYKDFGPYTQSARDRCLYQTAEDDAKAARRGVWHGAT